MNLKPLADRVVVMKTEEVKKTAGGIIIPDSHSEKPVEGTILAVGKDVKELKERDRVVFGKYSGTEVKVNDKILLVLKEEEVLGKLELE